VYPNPDGTRVISPEDIRLRARRLWASGEVLRARLVGGGLFPYAVPFRKPSAREWLERFAALRDAVGALEAGSKVNLGAGYSIAFKDTSHQKLGRLRVPERITFDTPEDAAACAGERAALAQFGEMAGTLRAAEPLLADWLAEHPFVALEHAAVLPRLLAVVSHFRIHPRPMRHARELGIPGVDSKFVERNRAILSEWLERVLPAEALDSSVRGLADGAFERRFGLLREEPLVRFRWLDRSLLLGGRIADASVPLSELAGYAPPCERVFVVENKINFLTLPECARGLAIFGAGYAVDRLAAVPWLSGKALHYWGDIDTHGFAILDRLRRHWPQTQSFLMDRETLLRHRDLWSEEPAERRCVRDLDALNPEETSLFDDLRNDRLGVGIRLEQERIQFSQVEAAVSAIWESASVFARSRVAGEGRSEG
jgi:hypothetical protein